jgi:hypothetical protein
LRVADIDAAVTALGKAGGAFISTGGKPLDLPAGPNTLKVGIVRDPDNLFLVLIHTPRRRADAARRLGVAGFHNFHFSTSGMKKSGLQVSYQRRKSALL